MPHTGRGFTLNELMIALVLATVLVSVAVPKLHQLAQEQRATSRTNTFVAYLNQARFMAIDQQTRVHLCPSADGATCLANDDGDLWHLGLMLYTGEQAEPVARFVESPLTGFEFNSGGRQRFTFHADGSARGYNGTINVCDSKGIAQGRAIVLSTAGRTRVSRTRPDGTPPCPP